MCIFAVKIQAFITLLAYRTKIRIERYIEKTLIRKDMAKPIKETPVLTGDDATRFVCVTNEFVPASNEEKEQAQQAFEFFASIAAFSM